MKFYLPTLKHLVIQLAKLQIYTLNLTTTFWHCKIKIPLLLNRSVPLPCICNELRNAVLLNTTLNLRHHGAPDYVSQILAIADSHFITNLIASLHLQVPRHLTTVKLMTESKTILACDSLLCIGWRHQKWLTRVGKKCYHGDGITPQSTNKFSKLNNLT